ncbi:ParB/RepB/Spo0J family partition protein [Streptomyces sp. DT224]|uniref:ParB/RepB/Spo0J family partition protein n=1 Tax=Streptomyces sp. DT224 TaxID=3393426 RepID=UPI003CF68CF2
MALNLKGAPNKRGSGVSDQKKDPQKFYSQPAQDGDVLDVPLEDIAPNPFNDIRSMGDLAQLAESIKDDGLLQSIVVMETSKFVEHWPDFVSGERAITKKYVIAFGERRWRASELAGKKTISTVLKNAVIPKIRRVLLVENLQRQAYSPMEEARNFHRLSVEEGMTYREIASAVKIGPTHVSRRLQLMSLPEPVQAAVESGDLGVTDARRLAENLPDSPEEQQAALRYAAEQGTTIKRAIQALNAGEVPVGDADDASKEQDAGNAKPSNLPVQRTEDGPAPDGQNEQSPSGEETEEEAPQPQTVVRKKPEPAAAKRRPTPAIDRSARERNSAAADREQACLHLVDKGFTPDEKQLNALYARTLLSPIQQGPAKARAHAWLRQAGKDVIGVSDSDSYFQAVLSSGNDELVRLATVVTALAASEIRAKDNRRQWDRTDAAHVQFLIQAAGYVVATQWERDQLKRFHVDFDATTPTDEPAP